MSNNRHGTLAEPHAGVAVAVCQWTENRFEVEYTGTPAQLAAAGIVNDGMQDKILNQRSGVMLDSNRHAFKIRGKPGMTKRATWEASSLCTVLYYGVRPAYVLTLPGVADLFPSGLADRERSELNATIEQLGSVARRMKQLDQQGEPLRCRIVGRRRREASWYALENVLFVNWTAIARDRVLARV